ncbi:MAG: radical SAM protein [Methanomicrobium sp.]|nr:radical SAM protein [Methanomicrobium sp.]
MENITASKNVTKAADSISKIAFILDGYVDEPACLGVPPYISPYVRYCAGVCAENGYEVKYATIDMLRKTPEILLEIEGCDLFICIAGVTVPGKYLGGTPADSGEINRIASSLKRPRKVLGGPIVFGNAAGGGSKAESDSYSLYDCLLSGEIADALNRYLKTYLEDPDGAGRHSNGTGGANAQNADNADNAETAGRIIRGTLEYGNIDHWSVLGSGIIKLHPSYPHVVCELETARGCSRAEVGGCAFCTEFLYGMPRYRTPEGITAEVAALHNAGARYFRLGRQPDLLAYGASSHMGTAKPRPEKIEALFAGIRESAPELKVLHIDNINPCTIAAYPDESRAALETIAAYNTAGDTAALGLESADPAVVEANNLKAYADDVYTAVKIINEAGAKRDINGVPKLLPGLNFVTNLAGETEETYDLNEKFLRRILDDGLMTRRINIRQVMPFEGTKAYGNNTIGLHAKRFKQFKENVREKFDLPMLKRVLPQGTILTDAVVEVSGNISFARQLGSYPILIGIPYELPVGTVGDFFVTDWGYRSVTAFQKPFRINTASHAVIKKLPNMGKKTGTNVFVKRPYRNAAEFGKVAGTQFYTEFIDFSL